MSNHRKVYSYSMIRDCHTMFRRLAALEAFDTGQQQQQYNQDQAYHYNTYLPNLIPTQSSYPAPQALRSALQNVNPLTGAATDVVSNPERLFRPTGPGQTLQQLQQACLAGSLDGLVGSQDPARKSAAAGCTRPPSLAVPLPRSHKAFSEPPRAPFQVSTIRPPTRRGSGTSNRHKNRFAPTPVSP